MRRETYLFLSIAVVISSAYLPCNLILHSFKLFPGYFPFGSTVS